MKARSIEIPVNPVDASKHSTSEAKQPRKSEAPLRPLVFDDQHNCFGCGAHNRIGLRLRFFLESRPAGETSATDAGADGTAGVVATLKMPRRFQGPHGFAHGGILAAILDEAMSKAIHASAHGARIMAMTRQMETEYLRPTPLGVPLALRGVQDRVEGRKHFCSATIADADGHVLARGKALFIAVERQSEHKH
jgi:uncharacterized protein (TIGR00369 family)